jgi:hypothetical protein
MILNLRYVTGVRVEIYLFIYNHYTFIILFHNIVNYNGRQRHIKLYTNCQNCLIHLSLYIKVLRLKIHWHWQSFKINFPCQQLFRLIYKYLCEYSYYYGRCGEVVGILAYYARDRGFDSRTVQIFVCMNMSCLLGLGVSMYNTYIHTTHALFPKG